MNGDTAMARAFGEALRTRLAERATWPFQLMVFPAFPYLGPLIEVARQHFPIGAQDCHPDAAGAYTGDVSAAMLADVGCSSVIIGHSERRADHGDTDALVAAKAAAAHAAGLIAILCVGETSAERAEGAAEAVVSAQLLASLPESATTDNTVIAYEPVWAIGSGKAATVEDVAVMHDHLRGVLGADRPACGAAKLLYGGSVKPGNARELLGLANVDGALVGGASLQVDDFWAIAQASH